MGTILDKIVSYKRGFVEDCRRKVPLAELKAMVEGLSQTQDFAGAIRKPDEVSVIAEIKRASPSRGLIRPDLDPARIAEIYERSGASAISVLTDERYFQGSIEYLRQARKATGLPILRKEFTIDEYQIYEARAAGADAVLLIAALLSTPELEDHLGVSAELGLGALVEVHSPEGLEKTLSAKAEIIGINNRDLRTFKTDLATTFNMLGWIPEHKLVVSESGICSREDVLRLKQAGVDAVLVGETLMREEDIGRKLKELLGKSAVDNF